MIARPLLLLSLGIALLATVACQNLVESAVSGAVEKATGVQVKTSGDGVTISTKDGESISVGTGQLDSSLSDFPVPSGFTLDSQASGAITSKEGRVVTGQWKGSTALDQVANFYKQQLPNKGYVEQFSATQGTTFQSSWKADKRDLIVNVTREGNTTTITALLNTSN